jgi:hypothetical protein
VVATSPTSESPFIYASALPIVSSAPVIGTRDRQRAWQAQQLLQSSHSGVFTSICFCGLLYQMNPLGQNSLLVKMVIRHAYDRRKS